MKEIRVNDMKADKMTAYDAFVEIIDINETIDRLKNSNVGPMPNLDTCKEVELLVKYRQLLAQVMKKTILGVFDNDCDRVED